MLFLVYPQNFIIDNKSNDVHKPHYDRAYQNHQDA